MADQLSCREARRKCHQCRHNGYCSESDDARIRADRERLDELAARLAGKRHFRFTATIKKIPLPLSWL
jgi:hypothetical protein